MSDSEYDNCDIVFNSNICEPKAPVVATTTTTQLMRPTTLAPVPVDIRDRQKREQAKNKHRKLRGLRIRVGLKHTIKSRLSKNACPDVIGTIAKDKLKMARQRRLKTGTEFPRMRKKAIEKAFGHTPVKEVDVKDILVEFRKFGLLRESTPTPCCIQHVKACNAKYTILSQKRLIKLIRILLNRGCVETHPGPSEDPNSDNFKEARRTVRFRKAMKSTAPTATTTTVPTVCPNQGQIVSADFVQQDGKRFTCRTCHVEVWQRKDKISFTHIASDVASEPNQATCPTTTSPTSMASAPTREQLEEAGVLSPEVPDIAADAPPPPTSNHVTPVDRQLIIGADPWQPQVPRSKRPILGKILTVSQLTALAKSLGIITVAGVVQVPRRTDMVKKPLPKGEQGYHPEDYRHVDDLTAPCVERPLELVEVTYFHFPRDFTGLKWLDRIINTVVKVSSQFTEIRPSWTRFPILSAITSVTTRVNNWARDNMVTTVVPYCPALVQEACMAFANNVNPDTVAMNTRPKVIRTPTLPVYDRDSTGLCKLDLVSATEEVSKVVALTQQDFRKDQPSAPLYGTQLCEVNYQPNPVVFTPGTRRYLPLVTALTRLVLQHQNQSWLTPEELVYMCGQAAWPALRIIVALTSGQFPVMPLFLLIANTTPLWSAVLRSAYSETYLNPNLGLSRGLANLSILIARRIYQLHKLYSLSRITLLALLTPLAVVTNSSRAITRIMDAVRPSTFIRGFQAFQSLSPIPFIKRLGGLIRGMTDLKRGLALLQRQ